MTCLVPYCFNNICYESFPIINTPYTTGEDLVKELSLFPESKELIEDAQKKIQQLGFRSLKVLLNQLPSGFDADGLYNLIRIKADLPASLQRGAFLFELTNIIQQEEYGKTWRNMLNDAFYSSEEFVRAVELIEYKGLVRSSQVIRKINKFCNNGQKLYAEIGGYEKYDMESINFEYYYTNLLASDHKEYYRNSWETRITDNQIRMIAAGAIGITALIGWAVKGIFCCALARFTGG